MSRRLSKPASRWLGVGIVALILFGPGFSELARLSLLQRRLDRRLAQLDAEYEQLLQEHKRLQSDEIYVEGLIRSTFKVAKPGEVVIPLDHRPPDPVDSRYNLTEALNR